MNNDIFTKTYLSILNENCEGCGKPDSECECEKNTEECNEQADACPKCGSPDCDGSCECNEEAEICPECGKPCAECECEKKADECNEEAETCPECGKPAAECECDDECNESCCKPQKPAKEITVESEGDDTEEYESEDDEEEEDEDGWPEDTVETFKDVLSDAANLSYELKNCVRGAYTGCDTKEELAAYIQDLINNFQEALDMFNA